MFDKLFLLMFMSPFTKFIGISENVKTITFLLVRRTDMPNILSVRPIFYRSGIKAQVTGNFLSVSRINKFENLSVRSNICRSRTDGFHILCIVYGFSCTAVVRIHFDLHFVSICNLIFQNV